MPKNPTLSPGDVNKAVPRAKRLAISHLKRLNKADLISDISVKSLTYGRGLEVAIKYIQRRYKLKVDGIIGPNTWKVLEYARPPRTTLPVLVIIPRAEWGARPAKGVSLAKWNKLTATRVHHTVSPAPKGSGAALLEEEKSAVREIQKYHMNKRKYVDIAYNFLIAPSGRVYEGRGAGVVGAHTLNHNEDCGIAFIGNYESDKLTQAQILAYKNLRRKLKLSGKQVAHKETFATSCPGKNAIEQLGL